MIDVLAETTPQNMHEIVRPEDAYVLGLEMVSRRGKGAVHFRVGNTPTICGHSEMMRHNTPVLRVHLCKTCRRVWRDS